MRLSVQIEFDKTLDLETPKTSVTVGRSPECDLVIPKDSVSRKHCRIDVVKGIFYLTDLGSSNGSYIDGERLEPNRKRAFLSTQHITIGKLDCEISDTVAPTQNQAKVVSSELSSRGDYTATMRISRLDLNKPSITLANEKKLKPKGPRNPVSEPSFKDDETKKDSKKIYIILFILVAVGLAWMMAPEN